MCERALKALAMMAVLALAGGCVGPARTSKDYSKKASTSLQDARSAVETARLAVDAGAGHRATGPYLSVLLSQAEKQAASVQATFDSIQPPGASADRIRHDVDGLLAESVSVLADLRIVARRGDTAGVSEKGPTLDALSRRLGDLQERLG
jgi:type II secretory pathway pseudopilin PulG